MFNRKIVLWVLTLFCISFTGLSFAGKKSDISDDSQKVAEKYLEINNTLSWWIDNNPHLWESVYFYTDKSTPSYVEYSVVCNRDIACWYIMVNIDEDDLEVPILSPSDIPPSQILQQKSEDTKENLEFYYFSPFDIYSQNKVNGQFNAIDPQTDPIESKFIRDDMKESERTQVKILIAEQKAKLPALFQKQLDEIITHKQSQDFQEFQTTLQNQNISINGNPWSIQNWEWKQVKWSTTWDCNSLVPYYEQWTYNYNGVWCLFGCSPVAAGIIFGYHDRVDNYPNLLSGTAPMTNPSWSSPANPMINQIRGYMNTHCISGEWGTDTPEDMANADKHPKSKWYTFSKWYVTYGNNGDLMNKIKSEINIWKPLILNITKKYSSWGHTIVWYGYHNPSNMSTTAVQINAGWWNSSTSNAVIYLHNVSLGGFARNTHSVVHYNIY